MEHIDRNIVAAIGTGLTARSSKISRRVRRTSGMKRHALRLRQRALGIEIRHFNLARAFVLGRTYITLESTCREEPKVWRIARFVAFFTGSGLTPSSLEKRVEEWLRKRESSPSTKGDLAS